MESEKSNANPAMRSEMLRWRGHSYAPYGPQSARTHTHTRSYFEWCCCCCIKVLWLRLRSLLMPANKRPHIVALSPPACQLPAKRPASSIIYAPANISDRLCNKNSKRRVNKINSCNKQSCVR